MTLSQALQNVSYDASWGIWAEKNVDGSFTDKSESRFGQVCFENGGLLDDMDFVCNGERPHEWANSWADGDSEFDSWADIDVLIGELNT